MDNSPFKKLPAELRVLIAEALFAESIVHVFYRSYPGSKPDELIWKAKNRQNFDALTLTCKELRADSLPTLNSTGTLIVHINKAEALRPKTARPLTIRPAYPPGSCRPIRSPPTPRLTLTPLKLLGHSVNAKYFAKKHIVIDVGAFDVVLHGEYGPGLPQLLLEYMDAFQKAPKSSLIKKCNIVRLFFEGLGSGGAAFNDPYRLECDFDCLNFQASITEVRSELHEIVKGLNVPSSTEASKLAPEEGHNQKPANLVRHSLDGQTKYIVTFEEGPHVELDTLSKTRKQGKVSQVDPVALDDIDDILKTWLLVDWNGGGTVHEKLYGWYRSMGRSVVFLEGLIRS